MHVYQKKQQEEQRMAGKSQVIVMQQIDFKNVQRRVYDALNVLSALQIISKIRNRVKFIGFSYIKRLGRCVASFELSKLEDNNTNHES